MRRGPRTGRGICGISALKRICAGCSGCCDLAAGAGPDGNFSGCQHASAADQSLHFIVAIGERKGSANAYRLAGTVFALLLPCLVTGTRDAGRIVIFKNSVDADLGVGHIEAVGDMVVRFGIDHHDILLFLFSVHGISIIQLGQFLLVDRLDGHIDQFVHAAFRL